MSYGSIDGVKDNLPKLRKYIKDDQDPDTTDLDIKFSTVERILSEISDQVNAALSKRYAVPLSDPPALINGITNDLAAFKISRSYQTTISAEENQNILALRKDAKEILAALSSGDYDLPGVESKDQEPDILDLLGEAAEELFDLEDESTWQDKI
jgi:phage gp36-like protein